MTRDLLAFAATTVRSDRYGLPVRRRGCAADVSCLGWVPGVAYRTYRGDSTDSVLGYTSDGRVVVRNSATGTVRTHRTARSTNLCDQPVHVTPLGMRLSSRP